MSSTKPNYWRSDITGLRALAVIPVVLYHAFPSLMPGGFVGVDIFFVISGFLISGIIFRQLKKTGKVDYFDFYAKRIRRILPNLTVLLLAVAAAGWFLLLPSEYSQLGKSIYSSAGFYQNFRLLKGAEDYFAVNVVNTPLLHLWSLAIEEQFYIVFPLLCWLVWKIRRGAAGIGMLVLAVTIGSFIACLLIQDQTFNFYFPLTRFWELGAGILLAYFVEFLGFRTSNVTLVVRNGISLLGLVMIVSAFVLFNHDTVFPGVSTLCPVLGAVFLIFAGSDAIVNRLLSLEPLVFIGLISYSLYLWHWPFLSYLHIAVGEPTNLQIIALVAASFAVSVITYICVENPVRRMSAGSLGRRSVLALACLLIACVVLGQSIKKAEGLDDRPVALVQKYGGFHKDWTYKDDVEEIVFEDIDMHQTRTGSHDILFIGDSHAQQYSPRVRKMAETIGRGGMFYIVPGCFAALDYRPAEKNKRCEVFGDNVRTILSKRRFRRVVIGNMFGRYMDDEGTVIGSNGERFEQHKDGTGEAFEQGLSRLLKMITVEFNTPVTIILNLPWEDNRTNEVHLGSSINSKWHPGHHFGVDHFKIFSNSSQHC